MWSKSGWGGGVGKGVRIVEERFIGKVGVVERFKGKVGVVGEVGEVGVV